MRRLALCYLTVPLLLFAANKERIWKSGKVAADSALASSEYARGNIKPARTAVDPHILVIQGDDYIYTVMEKSAWDGWCLLISNDGIKYAEDNRRLYVLDADGQRCTLDIVSQEKRSSP